MVFYTWHMLVLVCHVSGRFWAYAIHEAAGESNTARVVQNLLRQWQAQFNHLPILWWADNGKNIFKTRY